MKKILSMVAALALVLALAVSAFAAIPSVTYSGSVTPDLLAELTDLNLFIKVEPLTFANAEEQSAFEASLAEAIDKLLKVKDADVGGEIAVNVSIVDQDQNDASELFFKDHDSIEPLFAVDLGGKELLGVLHQKADGSWEKVNHELVDGKVKVTFTSLSPVVFVTKAKSEGGTSKPTGDTTGALAITFVALLAGAGYCFISARKAR